MDMLIVAYVISIDQLCLNSLAQEKFFLVRDVLRDGNCQFSAVTVQLDNLDIQHSETSLREQLVEYLQTHPCIHDGSSHFREYISALVVNDDPSNANTEASGEQDEFINATEDRCLRQQLRWLRYLERLNTSSASVQLT